VDFSATDVEAEILQHRDGIGLLKSGDLQDMRSVCHGGGFTA
jgi:hypothetical protein